MSYTHSNALGKYGVTQLIVATDPANGSHTTLASAISAATSGQTIFLRDSVTENVTLPAGINISSWSGGTLNTPTITGTITCTDAGTRNISGIRLQTNSAALLAVTGSAASIVNLTNCYLNCTNNTGITFSTSSSSAFISINNCSGDLGTTGIALFSHSSAGTIEFRDFTFSNSGGSSTANTCSSGVLNIRNSTFASPITTSGTAAVSWNGVNIDSGNNTAATLGGSGVHAIRYCRFQAGTASAVSIGSATPSLQNCVVASSNANAVTGAGTLTYSPISFESSSSTVNTSTQTPLQIGPRIYTNGGISFDSGTNLLANYATGSWTPELSLSTPGTSSFTYSTQLGSYTRIGNVVHITGRVVLTNFSIGTGSGVVFIGTFPIAAVTNSTLGYSLVTTLQNVTYGAGVLWYVGGIASGGSNSAFNGCVSATTVSQLQATGLSNTSIITINGTYLCA